MVDLIEDILKALYKGGKGFVMTVEESDTLEYQAALYIVRRGYANPTNYHSGFIVDEIASIQECNPDSKVKIGKLEFKISLEGISYIEDLYEQEKKERRKKFTFWFTTGVAILSNMLAVGALIVSIITLSK